MILPATSLNPTGVTAVLYTVGYCTGKSQRVQRGRGRREFVERPEKNYSTWFVDDRLVCSSAGVLYALVCKSRAYPAQQCSVC
jgi:hypothetical protein